MGMNSNPFKTLKTDTSKNNERKKQVGKTCERWPYMQYDSSHCKFVFLPWIHLMSGAYMLYVLDQEALNMTILDTTLPPRRMKGDIPFKRYVRTIIQMEQDYMLGMKAQGFGWKAIGIFHWKTIIPDDIPVDRDTLSGFHVLQLMAAWNNGQLTRINMDGRRIRNDFVIELLTYTGNSRRHSIPKEVQAYLSRIVGFLGVGCGHAGAEGGMRSSARWQPLLWRSPATSALAFSGAQEVFHELPANSVV